MLYLKCWPFFSQDPFFSVPHSTKKSPMLTSGSSTPYASAILGRGWTEWKHPRVAQRSDAFVTLRDSILLDLGQGKHGSKIGKERIFNTFTNLVDVLTRWVYFQDPLINMIYHDWFLDGGTFGVWTLTALSLYIIYLYKSLTVSLSLSLECFGVDLWFLLVGDMHQHVMKFSSARAYSSGGGGDFWLNDVVSLSNLGAEPFSDCKNPVLSDWDWHLKHFAPILGPRDALISHWSYSSRPQRPYNHIQSSCGWSNSYGQKGGSMITSWHM